MLIESLIMTYLYFLGFVSLNFLKDNKDKIIYLVAFPFGVALWCMFYIFYRLLFLDDTFVTYSNNQVAFYIFFSVSFLFILLKLKNSGFQLIAGSLLASVVFLFISLILSYFALPIILSQDSFYMGDIFYPFKDILLLGRPLFITSVQALSAMAGYDYFFSAYIYLLAGIFYGLIGYFVYYAIHDSHFDKQMKLLISILTPLLLLSTFMGVYMTFYLKNHLFISLTFLLTAFLFYRYSESKDERYLHLITFFMAVSVFMRVEIVIFAYLFMVVFLCSIKENRCRLFLKFASFFMLPALLWLGYLYMTLDEETYVSNAEYLYISIAMIVSYLVVSVLSFTNLHYGRFILNNLNKLIIYFLLGLVMLAFLVRPHTMFENLLSIIVNLYYERHGAWGVFWLFIVGVLGYLHVIKNKIEISFRYTEMFYFFTACFLAIIVLGFFRDFFPYRFGFGDSANRMIFHYVAFVLLFVMINTIEKFNLYNLKRKKVKNEYK